MATKRMRSPVLLAWLFCGSLAGVALAQSQPPVPGYPIQIVPPPPLEGKNSISGLKAYQDENGLWRAEFDYFYTGEPRGIILIVELDPGPKMTAGANVLSGSMVLEPLRGQNHANVSIAHPGMQKTSLQVSQQVVATMYGPRTTEPPIAQQQIDKKIEWPSAASYAAISRLARRSPKENLDEAVDLVDNIDSDDPRIISTLLLNAKFNLEWVVEKNPRFDDAYVELARIAMKSDWTTAGRHEAENLLNSALQIRPDSVNAKILLGYVYTHQQRYSKAAALFASIADAKTPNAWLWVNWGELLALQGNEGQALEKYQEATRGPMTHSNYDRARADAYRRMVEILQRRHDSDRMEAIYKQQLDEFGPNHNNATTYAGFLLQIRGDARNAADMARRALAANSLDEPARQILGLAQYSIWAESSGAETIDALNQARVYFPAGPMLLYRLADSEKTETAVRKLVAAGESIDQKDDDHMTALAYALQNTNLAAAKRLLKLGADPGTQAGALEIPVALMPVLSGDVDATRMLQESGVNYSKLRFQGASALEIARKSGNKAIVALLGGKGTSL